LAGMSPRLGVSRVPRALPMGLHSTGGRIIPKDLINWGVRDGDGYRPGNENGLVENLLSFSSEGFSKNLEHPEVKKIVAV
jgi:hypothetical protein